jgi:quercetin dioxygenase-like cupin family protein
VLLLLAVLLVGSASASPGQGVGSTVLGTGTFEGRLKIAVQGPSDFVFQEVGIAPGGHTGWHRHAGRQLVVVKGGTLTVAWADCTSHTYRAGEAFVETTGVHEGRNLDPSEPVELLVTYVNPAGSPLRTEADPPRCASSSSR